MALMGAVEARKGNWSILGYRYLDWNFKDNDNPVFGNLNISGPVAGVRFQF
jgi:hypothetical protein